MKKGKTKLRGKIKELNKLSEEYLNKPKKKKGALDYGLIDKIVKLADEISDLSKTAFENEVFEGLIKIADQKNIKITRNEVLKDGRPVRNNSSEVLV